MRRRAAVVLLGVAGAAGLGLSSVTGAADVDQPGEPLELGLADVELLTPATEAAGDRPAFSWTAIDGAASYSLQCSPRASRSGRGRALEPR